MRPWALSEAGIAPAVVGMLLGGITFLLATILGPLRVGGGSALAGTFQVLGNGDSAHRIGLALATIIQVLRWQSNRLWNILS